jgi:hypothetical protein
MGLSCGRPNGSNIVLRIPIALPEKRKLLRAIRRGVVIILDIAVLVSVLARVNSVK